MLTLFFKMVINYSSNKIVIFEANLFPVIKIEKEYLKKYRDF